MKKYIANLACAIICNTLMAISGLTATAKPNSASIPARHLSSGNTASQEIAATFVEQAYENARLNSPFAAFNAPDAASGIFGDFSPLTDKMIDYASRFLGTRYRLGADGPKAFDCSGFTSYVFKNFGIELKRSSRMQWEQGTRVDVKDLQPGDLMFFSSGRSGRGQVGHVAIVASVDPDNGTCKFIHASVKKGVTYQNFPDGAYYSSHFMGARRVIEDHHLKAAR